MKKLRFSIHFCGMSDETFTEHIMIYKPHISIVEKFTVEDLERLGVCNISDLIAYMKTVKSIREDLGSWGMANFSYMTTYIGYKDYLLGLREDKTISEIFDYFDTDQLELSHFIVGGASIHNETNYRFTVHSDERIHEHMPHVHVLKAGIDIRYSLDSLQPIDSLVNPHRRDNRRIILPFLKTNHDKLLEMWRHNINGYSTPDITEEERQFYSES